MLPSFHILLSTSFISATKKIPVKYFPCTYAISKQVCPPAPVFDSLTQTNSHSCWNIEQIPIWAGTLKTSHLGWNCKNFPPRLEDVFLSVARGEFHFLHSIGIKVELQSEANIYRFSFIDTPIFISLSNLCRKERLQTWSSSLRSWSTLAFLKDLPSNRSLDEHRDA